MRCEQIMKRTVECVTAKDSVQVAARKMRDQNVGFLPVCGLLDLCVPRISSAALTSRVALPSVRP